MKHNTSHYCCYLHLHQVLTISLERHGGREARKQEETENKRKHCNKINKHKMNKKKKKKKKMYCLKK